MAEDKNPGDGNRGERRKGERRQEQVPFHGPDRRKGGDRRSGKDRRANPRVQVKKD